MGKSQQWVLGMGWATVAASALALMWQTGALRVSFPFLYEGTTIHTCPPRGQCSERQQTCSLHTSAWIPLVRTSGKRKYGALVSR